MSLLKRMGYTKRKAGTKYNPILTGEEFERGKVDFLEKITRMVRVQSIPGSLVINWIKLV